MAGTPTRRYVASAPGLARSPAPISQAVVAGSHCYVSGQLAVDANGLFHHGSARGEAALALRNLFAALEGASFSPRDLVYVDVALTDITDLDEVNVLWAELFPEERRPARTVAQVVALPYGARVKVQGVAVRDGR